MGEIGRSHLEAQRVLVDVPLLGLRARLGEIGGDEWRCSGATVELQWRQRGGSPAPKTTRLAMTEGMEVPRRKMVARLYVASCTGSRQTACR